MAGLVVGEWFASVIISRLADKLLAYIADQYTYRHDVKTKLKSLSSNLTKIKAAIHTADAASPHLHNLSLRAWLADLNDAAHDAEDLLDKFDYRILARRHQVNTNLTSTSRKLVKQLLLADEDVNELFDIADRFGSIADQMGAFLNLPSPHPIHHQHSDLAIESHQTTSHLTESRVFGRDGEIAHLVNSLHNGSSSMVAIVGIGGVGKTTLAQCVYNDERIVSRFDLRVWICVSQFDVKRITKDIIQSASMFRPHDFHQLENLDKIQDILKKGLVGRRFLIVFDDVWNQTRRKWESLCTPLKFGKEGSRVLITTRNPKIARMMGAMDILSLEGLAEEAYWTFFQQSAFGDAKLEEYPKLVSIGREIARKLKGSPLAAKTVGGVLRAKLDSKHWQKILRSKLCEVEQGDDGILPALQLTYEHLPGHLKQCFVFCSLFPKGHVFERESLVRMWMAQGFIHSDDARTMEDIGRDYFDDLLLISFFQHAGQEEKNRFVIHDLLHEVAQSVSVDEYCRIENDEHKQIPKRVRHLCVFSNKLPKVYKNISELRRLRSLVLLGDVNFNNDCREIFSDLKNLRLLIISKFQGELPDAIGNLVHLRYLDLISTGTAKLPESLSKLYHLQGLNLQGCIDILPKGINNLINLRFLNASIKAVSGISGIGKLTSLQELAEYRVKRDNGHDIGELSEMKELSGQLRIRCLENVWNKKEAIEAMLDNKEHLHALQLEWVQPVKRYIKPTEYEEVLDNLQPHSNLVELVIKGYGGIRSPSWLKATLLSNLEAIHLENCGDWEVLPPLGHLPYLKVLHLTGLHGIKKIGREFYSGGKIEAVFPSLEELSFRDMDKWKMWYCVEEVRLLFPRLSKLLIAGCPNLRGPIPLPSALEELVIQTMPQDEDMASIFSREVMERDEGVSPPLWLYIKDTLQLVRWLPERSLSSLRGMEIRDFSNRMPFAKEEEWFQHLIALQQLTFVRCESLRSLPDRLTHLPSLERLQLTGCPGIQSLPELGLPTSLRKLFIHGCHSALAERCREVNGSDWHKIAHISEIRIVDHQNGVICDRHPTQPPVRKTFLTALFLLLLGPSIGLLRLRQFFKNSGVSMGIISAKS